MGFPKLFFILISQYFVPQTWNYCYYNEIGNYTIGTTYQKNLNKILSILSSDNETEIGFYNVTNGQEPDRVYATSLCRGDLKRNECRNCVKNSANSILKACPNSKQAFEYFSDTCTIRYSNETMVGLMEITPAYVLSSHIDISESDTFDEKLDTLLIELRNKASSGSSVLKYAVGTADLRFQTIYALEQCSPDLSEQLCDDCLRTAIGKLSNCCSGKQGGRVVLPSCNVRYETYIFYNNPYPTTYAPPPQVSFPPRDATTTIPSKQESNTLRTAILVVVPIVNVKVLITCFWIHSLTTRLRTRTNYFFK